MAFTDDFNRANENLEASANWTRVGGVAGGATVESNMLRAVTTTDTVYQAPDQGSADHYVQAAWLTSPNPGGPFLCTRVADGNNFVGLRYQGNVSQRWELYKRVAGSFTNLINYTAPLVSGDIARLEVEGNIARGYINGILRMQDTIDEASLTSTRSGFIVRGTAVNPLLDDFETGVAAPFSSVSLTDTNLQTPNQDVYTHSAIPLGDEASDRCIVVATIAVAGSLRSLVSVTVAGVTATIIENIDPNNSLGLAIAIAEVPTGTTGDIVVTYSGGTVTCNHIAVWPVTGIDPAAAHDTIVTTGAAESDMGGTIDVVAGGVLIAAEAFYGSSRQRTSGGCTPIPATVAGFPVSVDNNGTTATWTGVASNYTEQLEGTTSVSQAFIAVSFAPPSAGTDVSVDATGQSVTASVGTVTVQTDQVLTQTGQAATASVGTVTTQFDFAHSVTGQAATAAVGTATVSTGVNVSTNVTGEAVTASVGTVTAATDQVLSVTGNSATASVGTAAIATDQVLSVTGNSATASVGDATASVDVDVEVEVTGNSATASVGDVSVVQPVSVSVTGNSVTASVGNESIAQGAALSVTGQQGAVSVGTVSITTDAIIEVVTNLLTVSVGDETQQSWMDVVLPTTEWEDDTLPGNKVWTPISLPTTVWQ